MATEIEGPLLAGDARIAIVVARFNELVTERLLSGAQAAWQRHGGDPEAVTTLRVPGSFELPVAARRLAETERFEAIVPLGCVIQGATAHADHVTHAAIDGLNRVALETGLPVPLGIITAETVEQALERAGSKQGNQGERAVLAAIEMIHALRAVQQLGDEDE